MKHWLFFGQAPRPQQDVVEPRVSERREWRDPDVPEAVAWRVACMLDGTTMNRNMTHKEAPPQPYGLH